MPRSALSRIRLVSIVDRRRRRAVLLYRVRLADGRSVGWLPVRAVDRELVGAALAEGHAVPPLQLPGLASYRRLDAYVARAARAHPAPHGYQFVLARGGEVLLASPYIRVDRGAWS